MQEEDDLYRFVGFLAVVSLLAAVALTATSLSLPTWLQFSVDRTGLTNMTGLDYYTRSRGAFLTCLSDTSAPPLSMPAYVRQVKYESCLDVDLGGNLNNSMAGYLGIDADTILVLRKLHIGLHIASGAVLCIALLICLVVLVKKSDQSGLVAPTGLSLLAAGLQFGAHIAFNNALLRELLPPTRGTTAISGAALSLYNAWPSNLQLATTVNPGAAYYVALAAFSTCLASAGANLIGLVLTKRLGPATKTDEFESPFPPSGSAEKATNGGQVFQMQRYPVEQPTARVDAGSNWSTGTPSGRLPRTSVNHSYGAY